VLRSVHLLCLALGVLACRGKPPDPPPSPEAAWRQLSVAARAGSAERVWTLLDTESRWSLMSIFKDQQRICALVRAHYPKERQGRELERCRLSDGARDAQALFAAWAREQHALEAVAKLPVDGGARAELCREGSGWLYCGLRATLAELKLKTARDAAAIQENAEAFRR
jgi:hypothetical protein